MPKEHLSEKEKARRRRQKPLRVFIAALMVSATVGGVWVYNQYQQRQLIKAAANRSDSPESQEDFNKQLQQAGFKSLGNGEIVAGKNMEKNDLDELVEFAKDPENAVLNVTCTPTEDVSKPQYALNGIAVEERPKVFNMPEVIYNGKRYKRNSAVKAYLILGIDTDKSLKEKVDAHDTGRSDGIFLVAEDTAQKKVTIIQVPRDTMCDMYVTDYNFNILRIGHDHLSLAWWMGDNQELSGKLASTAVSWLFGGLPIDGYMAGPAGIVNKLNDYVGGVTVMVPDDALEKKDPIFQKGAFVNLQGEQAETFVRWRDVETAGTPMQRMNRQRVYSMAFERQLLALQKKDKETLKGMFDLIEDSIITDMDKGTYLNLALEMLTKSELLSENSFITPKGEEKITEYDEFWPDYSDIDKLVLNIFFREV